MIFLVFSFFLTQASAAHNEAHELVAKYEAHIRGKTFQSEADMTVDSAGAQRSLSMRIWSVGKEKALVKILKPTKEKNSGNLRLELNLWHYLPNIDRLVKIPPSLMLQSWMGSDFTNDDLVKSSSLERDYEHVLEKKEAISGFQAAKIQCIPKPSAPVVWGKVLLWVRFPDGAPIQQEFYSETGELLKTMVGSKHQQFGSHTIPTVLEMRNLKKKDSKTTLVYRNVIFDAPLKDSLFTQENLRTPVQD